MIILLCVAVFVGVVIIRNSNKKKNQPAKATVDNEAAFDEIKLADAFISESKPPTSSITEEIKVKEEIFHAAQPAKPFVQMGQQNTYSSFPGSSNQTSYSSQQPPIVSGYPLPYQTTPYSTVIPPYPIEQNDIPQPFS